MFKKDVWNESMTKIGCLIGIMPCVVYITAIYILLSNQICGIQAQLDEIERKLFG